MKTEPKKKLWFRARWFGWGWYPASWEGFAVIGVWALWIAILFKFVGVEKHPVWWLAGLWGSIPVLILVCWKTGERPSWRWAGKEVPAMTVLMKTAVIVGIAFGVAGAIAWFISK